MLLSKGRRIIEGVATVIGGTEPIALSVSIRPKAPATESAKKEEEEEEDEIRNNWRIQ